MDSFSDECEESRFFDALEHIEQETDFISNCDNNHEYDMWISTPQSVEERRLNFNKRMGLMNLDVLEEENSADKCGDDNTKGDPDFTRDIHRIMEDSGTVLRTSNIEDEFSSSRSSVSSWSMEEPGFSQGVGLNLNECRNVDANVGLNNLRQVECDTPRATNKLKEKWLSRLRSFTCLMKNNVKDDGIESNSLGQNEGKRIQRIKVRHSRRRLKELSGLFSGQDIRAHEGSILTMKFSLDGQYLASAGEDKIVRIWQIVEDERIDTIDIPDADPSCVYFSVNHLSELGPLMVEKDKVTKSKSFRKTPDSACIIFPPKVFRILEKPLHEFTGHKEEILDLSWSNNNCLLSSSVDKTVRLWQVGVDQCLKVFFHSDYVTCIQYNPVNDDYFISGSIDGKVRIWAINSCQVVDWTETKDIITAVSYRPNGQGCIVGSITGSCSFFSISDNHFQLETQMCLAGKKKSPCKRITGFQFVPQDPNKILVTCADSQVRIIDGTNVIGKYKGLRNTANQISASFTSDGKHIVSTSEDSNVYLWNYNGQISPSFYQPKTIKSFECFSSDSSVAIPWPGLQSNRSQESSINSLPFASSSYFSLSQDTSPKGTATWPEEKLPVSTPSSPMSKSHYKFLKTSCHSSSNSHAWGLVIVTAGWDGRIRSFQNYGLPVPL